MTANIATLPLFPLRWCKATYTLVGAIHNCVGRPMYKEVWALCTLDGDGDWVPASIDDVYIVVGVEGGDWCKKCQQESPVHHRVFKTSRYDSIVLKHDGKLPDTSMSLTCFTHVDELVPWEKLTDWWEDFRPTLNKIFCQQYELNSMLRKELGWRTIY